MRLPLTPLLILALAGRCAGQIATTHTAGAVLVNDESRPAGTGHAAGSNPQGDRASIVLLGNASNAFTTLLTQQNQVSYEPAINTVTFTHRGDPADFGGQGGTGTMRFDVSTDGGSTWTLDHLLTPNIFDGSADTIIGCRYPNGVIHNPAGNTDPANAFVVSTGMTLNTLDTAVGLVNTGYLQRSSARLDGTNANSAFQDFYGDRTTYAAYGLVAKGDGTFWALSARGSNAIGNTDSLSFQDFRINKGVWNQQEQYVQWTDVATITPDLLIYGDYLGTDAKNVFVYNWNMAFSPDGQTGYAVIIGKQNDAIPTGTMPLVWKSTDGGDNWNQLPNHDFSLDQWALDNIAPATDTDLPRPYFTDADITVDANGRLHMISSVISQYLGNSPDSVGFLFADIATQFIVHTSTSDGTDWTITTLSPKLNDNFQWEMNDGSSGPYQDDQPQASRTANGTHLFFTWNQSSEGTDENLYPEIHGTGYNATTGLWTAVRSLSAGTDADGVAWWHTVSPICISGGDDYTYELPTVFAIPGDYADVACGFNYIKGIGFNEEEFVVGVNELAEVGSLAVFPNPSEGAFTVALVNAGPVDVRVSDLRGRTVRTLRTNAVQFQLDLNDQPAGAYLLTAIGEKGRYTSKLLVR
jgi:Secretion system C-terminal sorting domain